jgi:hypothetical protein
VTDLGVQLITIFGVVVGAAVSFVFSQLADRSRWKRQRAERWDEKLLLSYVEFAQAATEHTWLASRIAASRGIETHSHPLDPSAGLEQLAQAEIILAAKWHSVLLLGNTETITAAQEWRESAWHLEWFARGLLADQAEWQSADRESELARERFCSSARRDLNISPEAVPAYKWPPLWQQEALLRRDGG